MPRVKARKTKNRATRKTNKRAVKPWISAAIIGGFSGRMVEQYVRVPVDFDGITPSVPYVIRVEREYFVRTDTNPLRYTSTTFGTATPLGRV